MVIPFGTSSYQLPALPLSAQRSINAYLEIAPPAAKTPAAVVQPFGIRDFVTLGQGAMRGGLQVNDKIYVVCGNGLYNVNPSTSATTLLGTIPGNVPVFMDGDGKNIFVSVNGPSYVYNGTTVKPISDPSFPGYEWVTFLDGYMVGGPGDGTVWINHTPYIPSQFNALDFASAESNPDDIVTGIVNHRELLLFGRETTEFWYNSGDAAFPLTRTASGYMEVGCSSKYGPVNVDNTVLFPGSNGVVFRVNGYTPQRISTTAVENAIEKYADKEPYGMGWIEHGHALYALTFNEGTWVYDISTGLWHEKQSYTKENWRVRFLIRAAATTYVGDRTSNRLGILDHALSTEWGEPVVSSVTSPAISQENEMLSHARLELVFEQGVGTLTGQGADPQAMLQWSDDGGRRWSSEVWRGLGEMGEYRRRVIWNRLGQSRDRVYRVSISDPVRRTLILATLNAP